MNIKNFRKILNAIDECDEVIKSFNLHGVRYLTEDNAKRTSNEIKACFEGALIERRANMLSQLKNAGVCIDELI